MEILNNENNLNAYLEKIHNKQITIVSAFASKTENLIDTMLKNENSIELIIGTINSFSSPDFIEHCRDIKNNKLNFSVDFGYQASTHWKVYLIAPKTVIIGSANFTSTGISLFRDTCVVITSKELHNNYKKEIATIKKSPAVIYSRTDTFNRHLNLYRANHDKMQKALARGMQYADGPDWLKDESNQSLPIFIWDTYHTEKTKERAQKVLKENTSTIEHKGIRDFFCYDASSGCPYNEGDIVICTSNKGHYLDFYNFDRIIKSGKTYYIYSLKQGKRFRPFPIKHRKSQIKIHLSDWYEQGITKLNRDNISSFMCDD
ncbi:phospholipase D family protein [Pseudomonas sp. PDM02]|uniref:phospholipase D family protein n=2 Tax=Pseudomonas TaxID=286 RepID=UPI0017874CD1|nr:phospholipase D family protein [Pseudomonas sp. PDM02]MBD9612486.1 phospholipase D family protein [Pseudomonas sp. PDM02]